MSNLRLQRYDEEKWTIFSPLRLIKYYGETKDKTNINIGTNIRQVRLSAGIGQTELVGLLQLHDVSMTRETLVKKERGIQHITVRQLRGIRDCLNTSYDKLLK